MGRQCAPPTWFVGAPTRVFISNSISNGTDRIVCRAGSMQLSGIRPSVRLSVCPTLSPNAAAVFAVVGPAARRYRSTAARPAGWRPAAAAPQHGAQQQMRAVPRCQLTLFRPFLSDSAVSLTETHRQTHRQTNTDRHVSSISPHPALL